MYSTLNYHVHIGNTLVSEPCCCREGFLRRTHSVCWWHKWQLLINILMWWFLYSAKF